MVAIRSRVCRRKLEWLHYVAPCGSDRFAGCREGELARQTTCGWPRQGWTRQGEWRFDPAQWPDPAGLVAELDRLGVKLMVSVWPTVNPASENYAEMEDLGLLVDNERGISVQLPIWDRGSTGRTLMTFYDSTNPQART